MAYLHDKNIVHGRLTTTNIYIEPNHNVKISLIDEHKSPLLMTETNSQSTSIDNNQIQPAIIADIRSLTYLSPELIRTIEITRECDKDFNSGSGCRMNLDKLGKFSDVFAFGTILYELFEEKIPFANGRKTTTSLPSADELIYSIGSGKIAARNLLKTDSRIPSRIIDLIAACWTTDITLRPKFKQLTI